LSEVIDTFIGNKGMPQSEMPKSVYATDDRDGLVSCARPMEAEIAKTLEPWQHMFEWLHVTRDYQSLKIWQVGKPRDCLRRHVVAHGKHEDMMLIAEADAAQDEWQSARAK
jgi:hypothetical protein